MTQERSHFTVRKSGDVNIVEFADRKILEELSISEILEGLTQLVASSRAIKLLLSFQNVEHLSSAALGMLITLNKHVGEQRGTLKLSNIAPQIYEVFKITRLNKLFDIYNTKEEALESH